MPQSEPRNENPPPPPSTVKLASEEMLRALDRLRRALRMEGIRIRDARFQAAGPDTEEGILIACEDGAESAISVLLTETHVVTYAPHGSVRYGRGYFPPAFFAQFIKQVFLGRAQIEALGDDPL